jgi:hypothetical protein
MVEIMRKVITVIDDFYDNPEQIREEALKAQYLDSGTYPGKDSRHNNFTPEMINKFAQIMGMPIIPVKHTGNYRLSLEGDTAKRHIHIDEENGYIASICLAKSEDVKGGLAMWKHKETGIEYVESDRASFISRTDMDPAYVEGVVVRQHGSDESMWDQVCLIPYRFNRCIIIDGRFFHSPWPQGFGDSVENGRLSQHFFFRSL